MAVEFTKEHENKINSSDKILRGNGKAGLRAEVQANTKSLGIIESAIRRATWWIITTLAMTLISIFITLILN